jgi:hypothetical protein
MQFGRISLPAAASDVRRPCTIEHKERIMNSNFSSVFGAAGTTPAVRHRVLRNTYWLLALSMIPTVLGAFIGVQAGITLPGGMLGMVLFLAIAFGFIYAIEKTKQSAAGVAVLLGFTFFMGMMLTPILTRTLGFANGGMLIMTAFGGTASILPASSCCWSHRWQIFSWACRRCRLLSRSWRSRFSRRISCTTSSASSTAAKPITSRPR